MADPLKMSFQGAENEFRKEEKYEPRAASRQNKVGFIGDTKIYDDWSDSLVTLEMVM